MHTKHLEKLKLRRAMKTRPKLPKLFKYEIILTRDVTESATIEVFAANRNDAIEAAYEREHDDDLKWSVNEGNEPDDAHFDVMESDDPRENVR